MENSIAIVGASCRMPSANNMDEFWEILSQGIDAIVPRPKHRPVTRGGQQMIGTVDPIEAGFLKCHVDEFDAKFFGVSPREAVFMDPQQRLLLEVAWESLENAGINPLELKGSDTSVFVGIWRGEYLDNIPFLTLSPENLHHRYTGNAFSASTSKISYFLGLHGPNLAVESGCSSSLSALHLACESLRRGETSLALCGGVNIILDEFAPLGYVLSKDRRCKTFDESADGLVRAEACGMVVLKRQADALNDRNKIFAVVRGSAMNNDGAGTSFGTPNPVAQQLVILSALKNAGIKPSEVNFIEAHGTGTAVGDPTEVCALGKIYSLGRKSDNPVWLSSVKSNMGHAESAAGIAGLLKVLLCFKNKSIPPHLHLKKINPDIQLNFIPAKIPHELTKWEGTSRIAALSSFSMSATNVHVLIEEAKENYEIMDKFSSDIQVLTISGKSEAALEAYCSRYVDFARMNPDANIQDISYGMNVERALFPYRIAFTATSMKEFGYKLETLEFEHGKAVRPKIAFLFTGQGSQYFGMAQDLYKTVPAFRSAWDLCSSSFSRCLGISLYDVVWSEPRYLQNTRYCQPAIFCVQVALTSMWNSLGISPDVVMGHSSGEFAAAVAAKILNFEDALKLVVRRSELVSQLEGVGAMLAVKVNEMTIRKLIKHFELEHNGEWVDIAAINSTEEVVVSGNKEAVFHFEQFSKAQKHVVKQIQASAAFHSRAMDSCMEDYGKIAETITHNTHEAKVTYISATRATEIKPEAFGPEYWKDHLRKPVLFSAAVKTISTHACNVFLEIGPQPILTALAMMELQTAPDSTGLVFCPSMRKKEENLKTLTKTLTKLFVTGAEINWKNWFVSKKRHAELPFYPFQRSKFWYECTSGNGDRQLPVSFSTPQLHPLLGCLVKPNVPVDQKTFCSRINIDDPSLAYLQDHKVGHKIIFPGAAYLEIILSAAKQLGISGPLTIENFAIEAPLQLESGVMLYTSVSKSSTDKETYKIRFHRVFGDGDVADRDITWKLQAKGTLKQCDKIPENGRNLETLKMQLSACDDHRVTEIYSLISKSGIQFGREFTRIRHFWLRGEELLAEIEVPINAIGNYTCHPVVLDAMLQTFAFMFVSNNTSDEKHIHLPVGIQKFTWLPKQITTALYAHLSWKNGVEQTKMVITIYNSKGEIIGLMERPEFIQTSLVAFIRHLNNTNGTKLPQMWESVWIPRTKSIRIPADQLTLQMPSISTTTIDNLIRTTAWEKDTLMAATDIGAIFIYVLLRTASEFNWGLEFGSTIKISSIRKSLSPEMQKLKAVECWMGILVREGYLMEIQKSRGTEFDVIRAIPDISECNRMISNTIDKVAASCKAGETFIPFAKRVAEKFGDVLGGRIEALELLFPNDKHEFGASRLYNESFLYQLAGKYGVAAILDCINTNPNLGVFRILEVGGGTGATTKQLLQEFVDLKLDVEYTFTDISPQFLSEGKTELARFEGTTVSLDYNLFNIEEDPLCQGFYPEQFDLVVGFSVLHATRDLHETLSNLKTVLRPAGILMFGEQLRDLDVITFSFGLLPGWWRSREFQKSPVINAATWKTILQQTGFTEVSILDQLNGFAGIVFGRVPVPMLPWQRSLQENSKMPTWLLFDDNSAICKSLAHKLELYGRKVFLVEQLVQTPNLVAIQKNFKGTSTDVLQLDPLKSVHFDFLFGYLHKNATLLEGIVYFSTFTSTEDEQSRENGINVNKTVPSGLLHFSQAYLAYVQRNSMKKATRLIGITSGVHSSCHESCGPGNPNNSSTWSLLTSFLNENPGLPVNVLDFDEAEVGEVDLKVAQIMSKLWAKNIESLTHISGWREFNLRLTSHLNHRVGLNLADIKQQFEVVLPDSKSIADLQIKKVEASLGPGNGEVEVEIRATALNFRDLFLMLRPDGFPLSPDALKGFGADISGVIRSVGFGTRFKVGDEVMTLQYYGGFKSHLVLRAAEVIHKPEQMTFVEAASIPCAFISAYASLTSTAGVKATDRVLIHVASGGLGHACIQIAKEAGATIFATAGSKRKRAYLKGIGILYVYSSRNTEFGDGILKDTAGKGVTVVVNSLTTPGFKETSLRICANGATFVELGKVDVWSVEEVSLRRSDVKYVLLDLSAYPVAKLVLLLGKMMTKFESGAYLPIPSTEFRLTHLREAFNYFREANHIGKVVIKMPELCSGVERNVWKYNMFNEKSTYLITGGLGGLGLEVTKWMLLSGAETVVLIGRSHASLEAQNLIDSWHNNNGANIQIFHVDVNDYTGIANLLKIIEKDFPPLRGIFHAAGTLSDDLISNQTTEKFMETFRPKVFGTWNLHSLTLKHPLKFFVSFSSVCAVFSRVGQSNHSAANFCMDSLMNYRRSMGLPGLTINWGVWGEVGAASKLAQGKKGNYGLLPFTPNQGIAALEYIMEHHLNQIMVLDIGDFNELKVMSPLGGNFYDEVKENVTTEEKAEQKEKHAQLLQAIRSSSSAEEAAPLLQNYIEAILKETLGMKYEEKIELDQNLLELGIDSLMALEIRNRLQSNLLREGLVLSVAALQANSTLNTLVATVGKLINDVADPKAEVDDLTRDSRSNKW